MSEPLHVYTGRPVVIDTSVAFKWFDDSEHGADAAFALLREHQREEVALTAPSHLALEVLNVMVSRKLPMHEMEAGVALLAAADLLVADIDDALLGRALRIAAAEQLALYDAVFIALAAALDAELVTADGRQAATRSCRVRFIG